VSAREGKKGSEEFDEREEVKESNDVEPSPKRSKN
jgi:hypothetical protein